MATITITDLDDGIHERLADRALREGRSIDAEARRVIEASLRPAGITGERLLSAIRRNMAGSGGFRSGEFIEPQRPPAGEPPEFE